MVSMFDLDPRNPSKGLILVVHPLSSGPMQAKRNLWLPILLMAVLAFTRWPGLLPPNFSAVYALAFCGGFYFVGAMAWWVPMVALILSNTLLNWLYYDYPVVNIYMLLTYLAFAGIVGIGRLFRYWLRQKPHPARLPAWKELTFLVGGGLLGAIVFYLITNTASWIFEPTYPKTLAGWIKALTKGTDGWPQTWTFFRNTLLSSGLFSALFVGAMQLSERREPQEESAHEEEEEPALEEAEPQPHKS
jgi:hypothetical protein